MKIVAIVISMISIILFSGCITTVKLNAAYPFEKRYPNNTNIQINGEKIEIPKGKSIWILTNETLYNLLENAKGK